MSDLTIEILKQIRDELKQVSQRIDSTNSRLDTTNSRLDETRSELSGRLDRLERRQTETEMRLATELISDASAVRELRDVLIEDRKLREAVSDHEKRIGTLERRAV